MITDVLAAARACAADPSPPHVSALRAALRQHDDALAADAMLGRLRGPRGEWRLNGQKRLLMRALVAKRGSVLTNREIAALLYGGRADGGPQDLDGLVAVVVSRIRRAIQATGAALEIRSIYGEGYALVDADG